MQGQLTQYTSTKKLKELFVKLVGHPAIQNSFDTRSETILLRVMVKGKKLLTGYKDTDRTTKFRDNLKKINSCLSRHWLDIELRDTEYPDLAAQIQSDPDKQPIDFSKRTLVRIFNGEDFESGGRFYRGWWQNIPSKYRRYLTIDTKRTEEHDFSQLNPNMIYCLAGKELGSEDAYSRVLGDQHRKIVKQAFNAMVQAKTNLAQCPDTIDLSGIDMTWVELREAILKAHNPIKDYFFKGMGNKLQYEDSCIAESVMLHFAEMDAPAYPVHDSFIMHHGYHSELREQMNKAFNERFKRHIDVDVELVDWSYLKSTPVNESIEFDDLVNAYKDVSQWHQRNEAWFNHTQPKPKRD